VKKEMPPVLAGHATPALKARAESFYRGVAEMFERWASRHGSSHTRRAYRRDVQSFVIGFFGPKGRRPPRSLRRVDGWPYDCIYN